MTLRVFLTGEWRFLAMLNYRVDAALLAPLVPRGTTLDDWLGATYVSLVGFLFRDTRVLGVPVPLHRDFEEVNLRFYVRRHVCDEVRRGVVFVRELVPKRAIATIARTFYGEPYLAVPMKHEIEHVDLSVRVKYSWRRGSEWESITMKASGEPQSIPAGSHAEFITEHYWGYTRLQAGCSEYRVEHPRWKVWNADTFEFNADVSALYGEQFVETLSASPRSAFIADGSPITVERRSLLL